MPQVSIQSGEIVKINGVPFRLTVRATAETSDANYKLAFNHDEHCSSNPRQAAGSESVDTSSLSLAPMCDHK
jgi:hypothetical protein